MESILVDLIGKFKPTYTGGIDVPLTLIKKMDSSQSAVSCIMSWSLISLKELKYEYKSYFMTSRCVHYIVKL